MPSSARMRHGSTPATSTRRCAAGSSIATRASCAELQERPDDPFILFNLGVIEVERKNWPAALGHLERSLALSAPTDSIVRKLFRRLPACTR